MLNDVLFNVLSDVVGDIDDGPINPDLLVSFRAGSLVNYGVEGGTAELSLSSGSVQKSYFDQDGILRWMDQDAGFCPYWLNGSKGMEVSPGFTQLVTDWQTLTDWASYGDAAASDDGTKIAGQTGWKISGQTADWHRVRSNILTTTATMVFKIWLGDGESGRIHLRDSTATVSTYINYDTSDQSTNVPMDDAGTVSLTWGTNEIDNGHELKIVFSPTNVGNEFNFGVGTGTANPTDSIHVLGAVCASGLHVAPLNSSSPAVRNDEAGTWAYVMPAALKAALADKGTLVVEWMPLVSKADVAALSAVHGIVGCTTSAYSMFYLGAAGRPRTYDGTVFLSNNSTDYSAGDRLTTLVSWDGEAASNGLGIATTLNGSTETDAIDFDGAFTLGDDLILGYDLGFPVVIFSVKLYRRVL